MKALGLQGRTLFLLTFVAFWLVNFPLSYALLFKWQYGFGGLWLAMSLALVLIVISYYVYIDLADW